MRLHVFSDNHVDANAGGGWTPELAPGADAVLCAGDVCEGLPEAFRILRAGIPQPTPIVTVAGNHSFYRRVVDEEWAAGQEAAREHGITLLENEAVVIGGVRVVGATLWSDYTLENEPIVGAIAAGRYVNDHKLISWRRDPREPFMPSHAADLHHGSLAALDRLLSQPFDGPTVVLTHHAPAPGSIAPRYRGDPLNPSFVSDLRGFIGAHQPALWVHGHTHSNADYRVGATRILCNPHGYGRENASGFDPRLVVEV